MFNFSLYSAFRDPKQLYYKWACQHGVLSWRLIIKQHCRPRQHNTRSPHYLVLNMDNIGELRVLGPRRHKSKSIPDDVWRRHEPEIRELHSTMTVGRLAEYMDRVHQFKATYVYFTTIRQNIPDMAFSVHANMELNLTNGTLRNTTREDHLRLQ